MSWCYMNYIFFYASQTFEKDFNKIPSRQRCPTVTENTLFVGVATITHFHEKYYLLLANVLHVKRSTTWEGWLHFIDVTLWHIYTILLHHYLKGYFAPLKFVMTSTSRGCVISKSSEQKEDFRHSVQTSTSW